MIDIEGSLYSFEYPIMLKDIVKKINPKKEVTACFVDNEIKSLNYSLEKDSKIKFIYLDSIEGGKIYEKTLLFLLVKAASEVLDEDIVIEHSFGGGIYFEYKSKKELNNDSILSLKEKMKKIIKDDFPIKKYKIQKKDVPYMLEKHVSFTNIDLMKYINQEEISIYELDGYYGYFYGKVLPSTSYVNKFDIIKYQNGAILLSVDDKLNVKEFKDFPKMFNEFNLFKDYLKRVGITNIPTLNKKIENDEMKEVILASEARHEFLISKIAEKIVHSKNKRIILIAGPSSSGKTTSSKRLKTHMIVRGKNPVTISLDDYFIDAKNTPLDKDGKPDFEALEAIDIDRFNKDLIDLINGKEVLLPRYNFKKGISEDGEVLKVSDDMPIIIEGIHGLNEKLTRKIPSSLKYKIYISPLTVMNIDAYNRTTTSDVRLIRRIVRDNANRAKSALETMKMWKKVVEGENKNIFPYQDQADYILNTALCYELAVLKKYAIPLLKEISKESEYYYLAKRLMDFLSFFLDIKDEDLIPKNSIIREFIGGSVYDV